MQQKSNQIIIIFLIAASIYLLYLLAPILTPFLVGALLAYLADPLVKKLEKWHVPHLLSVVSVFLFIFFIVLLLILIFSPLVQSQVKALIEVIPSIIIWFQNNISPWVSEQINIETLKTTLSANLTKTGWLLSAIVSSGYTITGWLVNLVLIPVVTFYLLRDWDRLLRGIKNILPKAIKPTTVKLIQECDEVLGAFFRGQLLVMFSLSLIYGIGLRSVGLGIGLIIGLIGGLLSIVPYLGSTFVIVAATIAALVQFGTWQSLIGVGVVFLIGQSIEAFVLTPYLIGGRIGLHPVAVIFAIMAGGTLFGFFGVLIALPTAAVVMVLLRFARERYA